MPDFFFIIALVLSHILKSKNKILYERHTPSRPEMKMAHREHYHHEITAEADKTCILSGMRHDIRTPMQVIRGVTSILASSSSLSSEEKEVVTALKKSGDLLFTLIDEVLDFAQENIVSEPETTNEHLG